MLAWLLLALTACHKDDDGPGWPTSASGGGDTAQICEDGEVAPAWYRDADLDGAGDPYVYVRSCLAPEGFVETGEDCDDADPSIGPHASETCNLLDDDCNGVVDDAAPEDALAWFVDGDEDHHGDPTRPVYACDWPEGTVAPGDDCDDSDPEIGAATTWYPDSDGDGWGDLNAAPDTWVESCLPPEDYAADRGDCDDNRSAANPGADEICDDSDRDCDGTVDEGC